MTTKRVEITTVAGNHYIGTLVKQTSTHVTMRVGGCKSIERIIPVFRIENLDIR